MLIGFILIQVVVVSSNFTTTHINHESEADMENGEEQNADADEIEKSLDLESRYKQLSQTLRQITGEENHVIYDRRHTFHRRGQRFPNLPNSGSAFNESTDEGSGSLPHIISDDDDYSMPNFEGSGAPLNYNEGDLDLSNEDHLVDLLSRKLDLDKNIGLEDIETTSVESSEATLATAAGTTVASKTPVEITTKKLFISKTLAVSSPLKPTMTLTSRQSNQPTSSASTVRVSHVTTTSRTTAKFSPRSEQKSNTQQDFKSRADAEGIGIFVLAGLVLLSLFNAL